MVDGIVFASGIQSAFRDYTPFIVQSSFFWIQRVLLSVEQEGGQKKANECMYVCVQKSAHCSRERAT